MRLEQLTSKVWLLPAHPDDDKVQPAVGVVMGDTETVLIDAGNTPHLARELLIELEQLKAPPVKHIVYTHYHWDHVFGACVFAAPVIAHFLCKKKLLEFAKLSWSEQVLQESVERGLIRAESAKIIREGVDDWDSFSVVLPTKTFDKKEALMGQGYRLELTHVNSKHANDSLLAEVVSENVMFVADAFYPAPLRVDPNDRTLDKMVLKTMLASVAEIFVHGHGDPLTRAEVQEVLESA
jgi:glyoxylase-like metal-dependent hydrolase (beta-lactamase superfamily II)